MKKNGNIAVNKTYNPRNVKPPIPIDAEEIDSAMERFIRQKYELKTLEDGRPKVPARQDPSYMPNPATISLEGGDEPPPLPPKPKKFGFGLRSVSSTLNLSSRRPSVSDSFTSRSRGNTVDSTSADTKLDTLRNMGFPDAKRNAAVLKGMNGNVDKAADTLRRLGEGSSTSLSTPQTPIPRSFTSPAPSDPPKSVTSTNPFDQLDSQPPRPTVGLQLNNTPLPSLPSQPATRTASPAKSYNPFDVPVSQPAAETTSLEQSMQGLNLSQNLFSTSGGYSNQSGQASPQPFTPSPLPASQLGGYNPFFPSTASAADGNQSQLTAQSNPFFASPVSQTPQGTSFAASSPFSTNAAPTPHIQRFNSMPSLPMVSSSFGYQQQQGPQFQTQQSSYNPFGPASPQPQSQQASYNPFGAASPQPQAPSPAQFFQQSPQSSQLISQQRSQQNYQQFPQQPFQQLPLNTQQTGRMDKQSILSLYNFSRPPPTIHEQPFSQPQNQQYSTPSANLPSFQSLLKHQPQSPSSPAEAFSPPIRSATMPIFPTSNPFMGSPPVSHGQSTTQFSSSASTSPFSSHPPTNPAATMAQSSFSTASIRTPMSRESMLIGGFQNGRHSPDAFASLSARY